jgi:chorismate dehydratase
MRRVKVSLISYLNTSPFVYGLKHSEVSEYIDIRYDTPADCAVRLLNRDADLGIVPSATLTSLPDRKIISNYCIGANGAVRSVALYSNRPPAETETLYLDFESRTSVLLARLLAEYHWKLTPEVRPLTSLDEVDPSRDDAAYVLIGDKTFEFDGRFVHKTDLAKEWKEFTGEPFVFALWTAVTPLSPVFVSMFNEALARGVNNIPAAIGEHRHVINYTDAIKYLTENIDYNFDFAKHKALMRFWNMVLKLKSKYRS